MADPTVQTAPIMPYQEARNILFAIEQLNAILARDDLTPADRQRTESMLANVQQQQGAATQANNEGTSGWRGLRQGLTFNLADEIANVPALFDDRDYATGLEESRALDMQAQRAAPDFFARGEMAGALGSMAIPMGFGARAATMPGRMARGAGAGAVVGGTAQFGRGEGGDGSALEQFMNRAGPAVPYAAAGGALGGVMPAASVAAGVTSRALLGGAERLPGVAPRAARTMARAFRRHEASDPQAISDYLARLGPEATLADVPGALRSTAMGLTSMPGAGGNVVTRVLEGRAQEASGRITATADSVLGSGTAAAGTRAAQADLRSGTVGPMYDAALAAPDPIDVSALRESIKGIVNRAGPSTSATLQRFIPDGDDGMTAARLHGYRSDLSDAAQAARQAGNGKQAAILSDALEQFDDVLDDVPGYSAARAAYAESQAVTRAADDGRAALGGGPTTAQTPAQVREEFARMSPGQQEAYRQGVREYVYAQMGTARNAPATVWADLTKEWTQEKLAAILGPDEAARIIDRLNSERIFSDTRARVSRGSDTAFRQGAAADLSDIRAPDTNRRPGPVASAWSAVNEGGNIALDTFFPGRALANIDVGRILSAQGPERDQLVRLLLEQAAKNPATAVQRAITAALRFGAPPSGMAAMQATQERR